MTVLPRNGVLHFFIVLTLCGLALIGTANLAVSSTTPFAMNGMHFGDTLQHFLSQMGIWCAALSAAAAILVGMVLALFGQGNRKDVAV